MGCGSSKVQVGDFSGQDDPEYDNSMANLIESIDEMIAAEGYTCDGYWFNLSRNGKSDLKLFKKQCQRLANTKSMAHVPKTVPKPGKDPNKQAFKLRGWIKPSDLRPFLKKYEPFDTSLDKDRHGKKNGKDGEELNDEIAHDFFTDYVSQHHNGESFVTDLEEGETAWRVIEQDTFKKDETTESQQRTIHRRAKRKQMGDITWMKHRRKEIATYFVKKRKFRKSHVKPYLAWAKLMMNSYLKFMDLC